MKRKLLTFICTAALVVCSAVALTACGGNDDNQTTVGHQHSLTLEEEKPATCTEDGYIAYYACSGCDKWFADKDGATEITDKSTVKIPRGHKLTPVEEKSATCTADGSIAYYVCSGCQKWFSDNGAHSEIVDKSQVVVPAGHKLTYVTEKAASCTEDGNTAHYICKGCDKMFTDNAAQTEITDKSSVVIAHTGHSLTHVEEKAVTCFVDGNIDYYVCGVCEKWFEDGAGETEITDRSSVVIVHKGHSYESEVCTVCGIHKPTDGLSYIEYDNYCRVAGIGTATGTNIYIADFYNGKPVTEIGSDAFKNCSSIESVTIPDGVTEIGNYAFEGCGSLKSITIPTRVTGIGENVFRECSSLTSISIPDNVTSIGYRAFENCSGLTSVTIGKSVKTIGGWAFSGCDSLTSVNIPDNVTSIGLVAFKNCSKLTSITIGNGVTSIGNSAFSGCILLESIIIPDGITVIEGYTFNDCSSLESVRLPETLTTIEYNSFFNCTGLSNVIIPDGVTKIGGWAFSGCSSLESVSLPDSVTVIGDSAFKECERLTEIKYAGNIVSWCSITGLKYLMYNGDNEKKLIIDGKEIVELSIPESITTIGDGTFAYCVGITSVTIPDTVTEIDYGAFTGCLNIESVKIPSAAIKKLPNENLKKAIITSGETIEESAFYNCSSLTEINISDSVKSIERFAFFGCSSLTSIVIPKDVTEICDSTFYNCTNLAEITIPEVVTEIGDSAFYNCNSLSGITIPKGVTAIKHAVFNGCSSLGDIIIPEKVTQIGVNAFFGCTKLASITLPKSLTSISDYAFSNGPAEIKYTGDIKSWCAIEGLLTLMCSDAPNRKLFIGGVEIKDKLTIPVGVTVIGDYAFYCCNSLTDITVADSVTEIGVAAFSRCNGLKSIKIPDGIKAIADSAFEECGNIEAVTLPIIALSKIPRFYLKKVVFTSGSSIADNAFSGCINLTEISLPDSVTSIGEQAFSGCIGLTSITIPDNTDTIGHYAFLNCDNLTDIYFDGDIAGWCSISGLINLMHNGVSDKSLYIDGTEITTLVVPDGVTYVSDGAFSNCSGLTSVTIPDSVTSIGGSVFYNCPNIESAKIPSLAISETALHSLKTVIITSGDTIEENAFIHHGNLETVTISKGVKSIGKSAFEGCQNLIDVNIPDSVKSIGENAFFNCSSLLQITIPQSVTSIGKSVFGYCEDLVIYCEASNKPSGWDIDWNSDWTFNSKTYSCPVIWNCGNNDKDSDGNAYTVIDEIWYSLKDGNASVVNLSKKSNTANIVNSVTYNSKDYSVTSIGENAFYGCNNLNSVTIPDGVTSIGENAFYCCTSLTKITIPDSVTSIGNEAFGECSLLTGITIGNGVTSIGDNAFFACNSLIEIKFKDMASYCQIDGLAGLMYIDKSKVYIGGQKLQEMTGITIPTGVTSIGSYAFYSCSSLMIIAIPDSVTSIGGYAFYNCEKLANITFDGTEKQWDAIDKVDLLFSTTVTIGFAKGDI